MSTILRAEQKSSLLDYQGQTERWLNSLSATLQTGPMNLQHVCRQWRAEAKALRASWNSLQLKLQKSRGLTRYKIQQDMARAHHALSVLVPALRYAEAALQRIASGDTPRAYAHASKLGKHLLGKVAYDRHFCGQALGSSHLEQRKVALGCLQNASGWPRHPAWVDALLEVDGKGGYGLQGWLGVCERDALIHRRTALREKVLRLVGTQLEKEERDMLVRFL